MTRAVDDGNVPPGFIRSIVERVAPSILMGRREGLSTVDELEGRHVVETGALLMQRSRIIAEKVESGACAIAGVAYKLSDGRAHQGGQQDCEDSGEATGAAAGVHGTDSPVRVGRRARTRT
nr:hypothetical protein GCM10017611_47250 [Rhodococcus wratislaviensis]